VHTDSTRTLCCLLARNEAACFGMLSLLSENDKIQWNTLVLNQLEVGMIPSVERAAALRGFRAGWQTQYHLMTLDGPTPESQKMDSDNEAKFRRLQIEDATLVNETWLYRSGKSLQMIQDMIGAPINTYRRYIISHEFCFQSVVQRLHWTSRTKTAAQHLHHGS
jgi:hypothetical protein